MKIARRVTSKLIEMQMRAKFESAKDYSSERICMPCAFCTGSRKNLSSKTNRDQDKPKKLKMSKKQMLRRRRMKNHPNTTKLIRLRQKLTTKSFFPLKNSRNTSLTRTTVKNTTNGQLTTIKRGLALHVKACAARCYFSS